MTELIMDSFSKCNKSSYMKIFHCMEPAGIKKYLSKIQVLSNVYLKLLKYKYTYTWTHAW